MYGVMVLFCFGLLDWVSWIFLGFAWICLVMLVLTSLFSAYIKSLLNEDSKFFKVWIIHKRLV